DLSRGQSLILALLEREGREQVLAHDAVLELGSLAEHVDQRLAVLDHERRLGRRLATARGEDVRQPSPPSERHRACRARSCHYVIQRPLCQIPSASIKACATFRPEYCCCPVISLPSRTTNALNKPPWT